MVDQRRREARRTETSPSPGTHERGEAHPNGDELRQAEPETPSPTGPSATALSSSVATLGLVAYLTAPGMGHFAGALVPWPVHGLSVAIILAASPRWRPRVTLACALALILGLAPNAVASLAFGGPARLVAAVLLVISQALVITLLYERLAGRAAPLSGTTAYARMLFAVVVGALPTTALAGLALRLSEADRAIGYSVWAWWTAAATSGAALIGITSALLHRSPREAPLTRARWAELVIVAAVYVIALASAFAEVGPFAGRITPGLAALPFLVWGGLRYGLRGYALIAALLIVGIVLPTWLDIGPFGRVDGDRLERWRNAWIYLASLVGPAMLFPVAIEQRTAADRRTREALAQLRALFESAGDPIAAVDRDLILVAANAAWRNAIERLTGARVLPGMAVADAVAGSDALRQHALEQWSRALAGESFTVESVLGDSARATDQFEISYAPVRDEQGTVVGASQIVRDITERRRREASAAEARRLESLGRLAGGVAHDFNNLMGAVLGYGELLHASMDDDDPRRADVVEVQLAAKRASGLTQQLLAFARRREVRPERVDVSAVLEGMGRLLSALVGPRVTLEIEAPAGLPHALFDVAQLEQVVMNLAVNARDAMPAGGRLRIVVEARTVHGALELLLTVADEGTGIFEPFFTTKPIGRGTGLGLATVHGIVYQVGGRIEVESVEGRGTTFRIALPLASPPPPAPRRP
jgi:PAS domain S-box-containing protein